ncbi:uncharacterized protein LOC121426522 [Lytechinus variegatus]|uniref:uncharacterized protein LOC121426522 n=1 Tax=Lytechinus variegatus TaxID=7654 RepID=UPI001BB2270C|nr:uncharacterized protein LOC121426522 [Lytechinus variegatus]
MNFLLYHIHKFYKMIESEFCALLVSINKLLSREQVQQLAFITMGDVKNRRLSEECERSGNALQLFQAMKDRDLYTHTEPSLLLHHLNVIDRHDAAMMLEKQMGVHSQNINQHMLSSSYQASGTRNGARETVERASTSSHSASSFGNLGQQAMSPLMNTSPACVDGVNGVFKDGSSACNPDHKPPTLNQGGQTGSRKLEPEASLYGDATSPRNLQSIPDRPGSSRDISSAAIKVNSEPSQDGRISSATGSSCNGSEMMHIGTLVSEENCQGNPGQHPGRGTAGPTVNGFIPTAPDRTMAAGTSQVHPPEVPPRPPRGIPMNGAFQPPIQESQENVPSAHPQQTFISSRQGADHVNPMTVQQQFPGGGHHIIRQGYERMYVPRIEVEQLQGRPPPVPERPVRRLEEAEYEVEELELCHLSRRFNAGDVNLLGHELGFDSGKISQLTYDNPHDISAVFYRLMVEWQSAQHSDSNTRGNLVDHLRQINCMGLADDLKQGRFKRR